MTSDEVFNTTSDFEFQPMNPNFRQKNCQHVPCSENATQVRYKKDINGSIDKSSKSFVCEEHLTSTQF